MNAAGFLRKPPMWEPCNGCGLCCATQLCDIAARAFNDHAPPCPALEWEDGRAWCGVVRHPAFYLVPQFMESDRAQFDAFWRPIAINAIEIGVGCGMRDEDEADALAALDDAPDSRAALKRGDQP